MTVNTASKMPQVGDVIGDRYVIQRLLARGGMGAVFVAQHKTTDAVVALKVLLEGSGDDATTRARFVREAKVAATLGHPGIVKVFDAGDDPQTGPYLAMELLDGQSLDRVIELQNPSIELRLSYVREMLEALTVAHQAGVVHRDIKPENLFLASDGEGGVRVKLLDFGIARVQQATTHTVDGTALGTIYYMAPEQMMDAGRASPAADVWSVGVMIYEMVCDELPFNGSTIHEVAVKVCTATPIALKDRVASVSPELSELIMNCLQKDPRKRPQTAGELASQLDVLGVFSSRGSRASLTPLRPMHAVAISPSTVETATKTIQSSPGTSPSLTPPIAASLAPALPAAPPVSSLDEPPRTTLTPSGAATVVAVRNDLTGTKKSSMLPAVALGGLLLVGVGAFLARDRFGANRDQQLRPVATSSQNTAQNPTINSAQPSTPDQTNTANTTTVTPTSNAAADAGTSGSVASPTATVLANNAQTAAAGGRNARVLRPSTTTATTPTEAAPVAQTLPTPVQNPVPVGEAPRPTPAVVQPMVQPVVQPVIQPTVAQGSPTNSQPTQPVVRPAQPTTPVQQPRVQHPVQPTPQEPEAPVSF